MFKNLKFMGVLVLTVLLLTNCNKEAKQDPTALGEVTFAAIDIDPDKDYDIVCVDGVATHARVNIDGTFYYPAVFIIDGKLKTQSIKLPPGDYTLLEFSLMTDGIDADDHNGGGHVPLKSTPMASSDYAQYVSYPLPHEFEIRAFEKDEQWIDVLCYVPVHYEEFGFTWWEVRELTIRTQCFFGDFCIKHLPDYVGSNYALNGLQLDEVAIFKIVATRNGDDIGTFYNTYGEDDELQFESPLCVEYADYDNEEDNFVFELWIYVKVGNTFQYVYFHTWTFDDAEMIYSGTDEDWVVDFVLGNCVYTEPDLLLPPYMNLPCGFDYVVTSDNDDAYFNAHFNGIGAGYDILDGTFPAWCADLQHFITPGTHYNMCAYSSLYVGSLPSSCDDVTDWSTMGDELARINWVFNHLYLMPDGYTADDMQGAIWLIVDPNANSAAPWPYGIGSSTAAMDAIVALAAGHGDFSPLPGGWAAVLMYTIVGDDECVNTQITFRVVDP